LVHFSVGLKITGSNIQIWDGKCNPVELEISIQSKGHTTTMAQSGTSEQF